MIATKISPREFYNSLSDRPRIVHDKNYQFARYYFDLDVIVIPFEEADNFDKYNSALYHEYCHKLFSNYQDSHNGFLSGDVDEKPFSEIICQIGSLFIAERTGVDDLTDSIDYIKGWMQDIKDRFLLLEITTVVLSMMESIFHQKFYWMDMPIEAMELICED